MANVVNTFTLKLEEQDFKNNLKKLTEEQKNYQNQIAKSIADSANKQQSIAKKQEGWAKRKAELQKQDTEEAKEAIRKIDARVKSNNTLIASEKKKITQLNSARRELDGLYNSQIKSVKQTEKQTETVDSDTKSKIANKKATTNITNTLVRHLRQVETLVIAYYALSRGYKNTIGLGIEVNKMMEDNTSGIAALISANTQMVLSNGEVVNSYEKFKIGQTIATQTMEDLKKASIETYATFPQLTEIFQQSIGHTLGMGKAFGATTDEIIQNTIKFTQSMSNIGGSVGMEMQKVQEEVRSMLSGNVSTDSLLAVMLFGSPTKANEAIREAKKRGENGVSDMLNGMMEAFEPLKDTDTYTRSLLELENAWSQLWKTVSEPLFEDLKITFKDLASDINNARESLLEFNATVDGLKDIKPGSGIDTLVIQWNQVNEKIEKYNKQIENSKKSFLNWDYEPLGNAKVELELALAEMMKIERFMNKLGEDKPKLLTEITIDYEYIGKRTKDNNKNLLETQKLENLILKDKEQIVKLEEKKKILESADTDGKELLAVKTSILELEKSTEISTQKIADIKLKTQLKELDTKQKKKELDDKLLRITEQLQGAEVEKSTQMSKTLTDAYERLDIETREVEKSKLKIDIGKQIMAIEQQVTKEEKERNKEKKKNNKQTMKDFEAEQNLRKLEISLMTNEEQKSIELAKLSYEDRKEALLENYKITDQYYIDTMEMEDELLERILFGYSTTGTLIRSTSSQMQSSMGDFFDYASDGFLDFGDLATEVLHQIYMDMVKLSVINPLVEAGTTAATSYFSSSQTYTPDTDYSYAGYDPTMNAKGGVYSSESLSSHTNTVVSNPTPFYFAKGGVPNLGIFGEAGSEAIMPLTKTSDGDLGVKAVYSDTTQKKVTVNIVNESGNDVEATSAEAKFDMDAMVLNIVIDGVANNKMGMRDLMGRV